MEQQVIPSDYTQYAEAVEIIKHAIERCRYRSAAAVNKETLSLYFGVGKFVSENSRIGCWGTKALPTISKLLQRELPGLHGFSESGLKRMRSFYEEWRTFLIRPPLCRSKCVVAILSQKLLERRHLFKSRIFAEQLPSSAARSHLCRKSDIGVQG